jgi:diguanylate cyclase (GGDEF)-like protein/PAS domain S-box-containing protein
MYFEKIKLTLKKPKVIIPLLSIFILNIAIGSIAYIYTIKSEQLAFNQAFKHLENINNIKAHKLKLFFNYRKSDIQTLAHTQDIISLTKKLKHNISSSITGIRDEQTFIDFFIKENVYTNIMIVDPQSSKVIYSTSKKKALGFDMGSLATIDSNFGKMYKNVLNNEEVSISDISLCVFSKSETIMGLVSPIKDNDEMIGILLLEMPSSAINDIMHYRDGMGQTGESYAVGEDDLLRSDSYLKEEFSVLNSFKYPDTYFVKTDSTKKALSGLSGTQIVKDYRDTDVLSAYQSFDFKDFRWALISEIDKSEIEKEFISIKNEIRIFSTLSSLLITIIFYIIITDVIRKTVVAPLKKAYNKAKIFEDIIENSLNEIYIFDASSLMFDYANKGALQNCGYTIDEFLKMTPLDIKPNFSFEQFRDVIRPLKNKDKEIIVFETKHKRKDNSLYDADIHLQLINIEGEDKYVAFINDISKRKEAIAQKDYFYKKAIHDHLTKIYNRQMFDEIYEKEFSASKRYNNRLSLILFDIDDFKNVNDTYGHDVGDKVLISISSSVKKLLRDSDVFARWGGEEFIILMRNTHINKAYDKAQDIRRVISENKIETVGNVTCSFGVSTLSEHSNMQQIFKDADNALYKAKHNGKNRVEKSLD